MAATKTVSLNRRIGVHQVTVAAVEYCNPMLLRQTIASGSVERNGEELPAELALNLGGGHILVQVGSRWFAVAPDALLEACAELPEPEVSNA